MNENPVFDAICENCGKDLASHDVDYVCFVAGFRVDGQTFYNPNHVIIHITNRGRTNAWYNSDNEIYEYFEIYKHTNSNPYYTVKSGAHAGQTVYVCDASVYDGGKKVKGEEIKIFDLK